MDLKTKVCYTSNWIDGIARSDSETVEDVDAALDAVVAHATSAKATASARPREAQKIAVGTDEPAIRAKIAHVQAQRAKATDPETIAFLDDMERTLGAMLPPVTGKLVVGGGAMTAEGGG